MEDEKKDDVQMLVGVSKQIADIAEKSKKKRSMTFLGLQETLKEKMMKFKEERMDRLSGLQMQHRHVLEMVAIYLGLESNEVMDGAIDDASTLPYFLNTFVENGKPLCIIYYQEADYPSLESGRYNPMMQGMKMNRIQITDGTNMPLLGRAVLVYRINTAKTVEMRNVTEDIYYMQIDMTKGSKSIVSALYDLLDRYIRTPLSNYKDWGDLNKTEAGRITRKEFVGDFLSFLTFLDTTRIDLEGLVHFNKDNNFYNMYLSKPDLIRKAAIKPDTLKKTEAQVRVWAKQIEMVLTQFQQLRRENEFVGPMVEIEYWRRQLAKFTSIVEFVSTKECQNYLTCLQMANIKSLKVWKKQDNAVTDARNECADNVKYLYAMEKYCEPLYRCDPTLIPLHLPTLLQAIRMTFVTSRYYNNTANVTAILVKISNQMINSCKTYLSCDNTKTVWGQPKVAVLEKIKVCLDLYLKYYQCFKHTQQQMLAAGEPSFDCSEMYVFGKFETFKKRLEEITDVISTSVKYSILCSSTIEGIDYFANKFRDFFLTISTKKYDALNHRLDFFDKDYDIYKTQVFELEWEMEEFVGKSLEKMTDVDNVLRLLKRFQKLNLECLHLDERYLEAIAMFQQEIAFLRDKYNEDRSNPALPRNIPPISGRIMWIRQLYKRIEEPMEIFKTRIKVMKHKKTQKCIQLFNSLAMVFVHYEQLYHEAWCKYVGEVRSSLSAPLIIKHQHTRRYTVNFDPYIWEVIRETEYIYKLSLKVPEVAQIILFCKDKILYSCEVVTSLVHRNDELRQSIPKIFIPLMRSQLIKMENAFMPAFSSITWTSMKIPDFCEEVTRVLDYIEVFVKELSDMVEARINEVLNGIQKIPLVIIPDEAVQPAQLLEINLKHREQAAKEIELKSSTAERTLIELINKFVATVTQPELQVEKYNWLDSEKAVKPVGSSSKLLMGENAAFKEIDRNQPLDLSTLHNDCIEMFALFNMRLVDALVKCTKMSLDVLKQKVMTTSLHDMQAGSPLVQTYMELQIPINKINPSLEEIGHYYVHLLNNILDTHKYIVMWGQRGTSLGENAISAEEHLLMGCSNYYKTVSEHKEIVRMFMSLQGALYLVKPDVHNLLEEYLKYSYLWAEGREEEIINFCLQNPLVVEIKEKFTEYDNRAEAIRNIPRVHKIGALEINMERYKLALLVESEAWKHLLGKNLCFMYKGKLVNMVDFIKNQEKILAKPIKDLDDCRLAMSCLERIRENFIEMDMDLGLMEEAYSTFTKFQVAVPKEDIERVDTLRYNFNQMVQHSKQVQEQICTVQGPLQNELTSGVAMFSQEVEEFDLDFETKGPMIPGLSAREASDRVLLFQSRFDDLWRRFEMYSSGERLFGMEVSDYPILHQRKKDLNLLQKLYGLYIMVNNSIDGYFDILWTDVEFENIMAELTDFQNRCRKLPKGMKDWPAFLELKKKIDDFNETCPLLELMANKAMKERHWKRISAVTGYSFDVESPTFLLRNVMEAPLLKFKDDVEDICISAVKEKDIEAKLKQVIADWAIVDLQFSAFKSRGELLLKGTETGEIIAALEDSLMVMNSLLSNRYNAPFKKDIQLWVWKLVSTSEILEKWLIVQNLWVYLEAVFVGGDIARQLPTEAKRFSGIDKAWVKLMSRARDIANAVECCTGDETMGQLLPHLLEQLETCQKSLTGYLESKRLLFPRFFFISDPVLLEILGQSSDPQSIQPHLLSLFDAVYRVDFDEKNPDNITGMNSDLGENIPFEKPVVCTGGVEFWLNILLNTVKETVRNVIASQCQALNDPEYDFVSGFIPSCGQAGLVGVQVLWTKEAELALKKCRFDKAIMKITNQRFLDLLNSLIDLTSKDLSKMQRIRFETMVTIHVHQRDIFDDIVKLKIRTLTDFEWQKQARFYYFEENDDVLVKITDVIFIYQNEYLGITERLAITPLTDRCYITLAQAIWMNMGGAPAGPAGTGKTETTKDMGRTLGKLVVVFNCSDQMDFRGLGRIFKGLAQSGTWGCFDEFNRIELPVLSVAAQQIYIVLLARKERKQVFIFSDGDNVSMNLEFGIFLTMNPGYAGRQELPENLKILFRSVAMMVPDRQIIIRVKLASCGFKDNIILCRKFFTLYKLCEEQLSKQVHYDFGLRNILSVLRTLGAQKRANPHDTEETIVMRVLRDMNLSKLVDEDEPLFLSLIEDMFPGIKLTTHAWKDLQKAITSQCDKMGLINHPSWNLKIIQLYETSLVRHGLMILGPTGAGKTKCMSCLMRAMTECGSAHKELRMNPKAITAPQMFGRLDVATNDWTDGIFSTLWRRTLKVKKTENCWLVLDGPVDAVWIENLNSVLDDNKTLTLANGDRIVMAPNCKLVFEPDNVDNASPATVSRMGMVFISASALPWQPILEGWLKNRTQQESDVLRTLYNKIYDDLLLLLISKLKPKMYIREAVYTRQSTDILEGILGSVEDGRVLHEKHLERLFLFAVMWSLGAVLELDDREKFEQGAVKHPMRMDWPKVKEDETIFEYVVGENGKWQHWSQRVEEFMYPTDAVLEYSSILIPNVDNVRTGFLIDIIAKQNKAVLLIGEQGTAKTVMLKSYTAQFDPEFKLSKSFNFSSETNPNMVQRIIESYVDKRVGTTYGPPAGKTLTIFIDDINMPVINAWGDQITNEIVRQLMETGGFFSLDKPGDFSTIMDISFLAAMIHPGGGRNDIPHRLKRQFCTFNCTLPSINSMDMIFRKIGEGYFCIERFNETVVEFVPKLIPLTRHLWQNTKKKLLPTPAKFHYVFNLRDLSRIWQGILYVQHAECTTIKLLLSLWKHECSRVIADRCTNESDRNWFHVNMLKLVKEELGDDIFENHFPDEEPHWVDYLRDPPEPTGEEPEDFVFEAPKIYEEIPSWEFLLERTRAYMDQYNEQIRGAAMDLVLFNDAMYHLMIISRIVRTPRGNALLVGVGGSGKQSLTKLASFIAGYRSYQITLTRIYNMNNLMEDMKYLYRTAGAQGLGTTFIFTDNDIKEENFLECLNNVLSSGEIANLFAKDELDEIQTALIPVMKKIKPKTPPTGDNLYEFFITRARSNLHVVLCFSPVGEKFRSRSLKFPGLISGCTIDWFSKWPKDALVAVSSHFLEFFKIVSTPESKEELIYSVAEVHDSVAELCVNYFERFRRQTFVTPKTYLSFLDSYKALYVDKEKGIDILAQRMRTGLTKLVEAAGSVDLLRQELAVKDKEIAVATAAAEKVLATVMVASEIANKIKVEAEIVAERAESLVVSISADQKVAEGKLLAAKPALDAAEAALLTIKAADISTVRKLGKPPFLITLIMDAVIIYFKKKLESVKPDFEKNFLVPSWSESLKVMADTKFLSNLQLYPKDTINSEIVDLLVPYFEYPQYTFEAAKIACGNVAGLISWTIAMSAFYEVNKEVLPLKANLAREQAKLDKAQAEYTAAMDLLHSKEEEVRACTLEYETAMAAKQEVFESAMKVKNKMDAATALIDGLSGERIRWTEQSAQFKAETERLIGDVLLLVAFLSYAGPFNQEFRMNMQKFWLDEVIRRKIPVTQGLNVTDSMSDTATVGEWNLQGLPNDELSVQNGIIVTKASRFPLLIDPQSQGKAWIKNKEMANNMIVTTLNHRYFRVHVEDCIQLGRPMIIEDMGEELDPMLNNVLEKNYIKIGSTYKVKLSDKEVDVNFDFRIYMTTRLANPSYTPEIFARTSIIDFTVTMQGLEDQLLGRVILTEKRELETERTNLLIDVTANKRKMLELEQNLLYKLTTIQGSLLDDESVIGVLNVTKNTAAEVREKLSIAKETEIKINAAREEYRPVATRGSVLYFIICSMAMVNVMYQTSLVQFLERFDISMTRSEKTAITARRINYIIEYLTYEIFKYICRGLYEVHKYMFVLLMCLKIDVQKEVLTHEEFQNFIKGGAALDLNACPPKPAKWITDTTWLNLVELSKLRHYQYIVQQTTSNDKIWKVWFDKDAPEESMIPDGYNVLDPFRKLLMIRAWCPDRIITQSRKYLASSLGIKYTEPVILNLEIMHGESRPMTPLICFLSTGSDPTPYIEQLAKRMENKCKCMSMGQGQEVHARKMLTNAMAEGFWALLQNCHLGLEYMNEVLGQFLEMEKMTNPTHPDFRLWITTEPHDEFPISLLQLSIKFTNEPPSGVRAGLLRTYTTMNPDMLDYNDQPQYVPLIYAISFLHTVVQERRKFGPLGWNIPYEFNSADWLASCMFVQNHLDDIDPKRGVSWNTLRYMLGEVQYGGRVTDDYDKRLLNTFAKVWFCDNMFLDDFQFYKGYKIIRFKNIADYTEAIDAFSSIDPPQVYGLHPNANITYQTNSIIGMLDTMLSIQPKESAEGSGETREEVVLRQVLDMTSKLPPVYDPFEVKERLKTMGLLNSLNIFLRQEIDRMQKVLQLVKATLRDLVLAIEGTIIMNESLRDALDNIYDARVPFVWRRGSWEASSLGFWFTELLERNLQFRTWCFQGRPSAFWMTGFFNPQGFLTAMRQEVARAHKGWALDQVSLYNEVTKNFIDEIKAPPVEGVYVYGLFLDGAGWDRRNCRLSESINKVLYTLIPVIWISAINSTDPKDPKLYTCPVYKKARRTDLNYITPLWLQTIKPPEHWILRGVALLCDTK